MERALIMGGGPPPSLVAPTTRSGYHSHVIVVALVTTGARIEAHIPLILLLDLSHASSVMRGPWQRRALSAACLCPPDTVVVVTQFRFIRQYYRSNVSVLMVHTCFSACEYLSSPFGRRAVVVAPV
jgi:hypothetical protein